MSNATTNPQVQSIRTKLSNLAKREGVDFPKLLTLFLLERAAYRLLQDAVLARHLIFKGGFVSVRVYNSPRYTVDLDALVQGLSKEAAAERIKAAMAVEIGDGCWFEFEEVIDLKTQGEYGGTRFVHRGGLGDKPPRLQMAQVIHLDVGVGDPVTPAPVSLATALTLGEGKLSWQVYPAETIVAEKLHALVTLGARNSRSKDIFDIKLLLPQTQKQALQAALQATFAFRGDPLPASVAQAIAAFDRDFLKRGWASAVGAVKGAADFDGAFASILVTLEEWGI